MIEIDRLHQGWGIETLHQEHPKISAIVTKDSELRLEGRIECRVSGFGHENIPIEYKVRILVPKGFPRAIPTVFEIGGKIAPDYHKLENGSLCLGAPIILKSLLLQHPTLVGFINYQLIPYLFNHHVYVKTGSCPVGELPHGTSGLIEDYARILNVSSTNECIAMLRLLGTKKRLANKQACPCRSGRRVGRCHNNILNPMRRLLGRREFKYEAAKLIEDLNQEKAITRKIAHHNLYSQSNPPTEDVAVD